MPGDIPCNALTYATVCSGVECMSVAAMGLPLKPVFFSEIEPYPCAVLKAHYPDVPNLGDMSKIQVLDDGREITNGSTAIRLVRRVDILAGGTPCQDVSVAGKRAGMQEGSGTRSSLAFDFVRLARELGPRYVIWENVAGAIDSKNAPDFLRFVGALGDCGYTLAWRVLDAQYVRVDGMDRAVPQRRRRVWVVGCLGADECAPAQILFEPDCVAGHTPPRRRAGQGFAYFASRCNRVDAGVVGEPRSCAVRTANTHANGHGVADEATHTIDGANGQGVAYCADGGDVASTITRQISEQSGQDNRANAVVQCYENHAQDSRIKPIEVSDTRNQKDGTGGNNLPLVCFSKVSHPSAPNGEGERWEEREVAQTRNTFDNGEKRCQEVVVSMAQNTRDEVRIIGGDGQIAGALPAEPGMKQQTYVVSTNSNGEDVAATVNANMSKLGGDNQTTFGGGMSLAAVGIGHDAYNSGRNAKMGMSISSEVEPTMKAKSDGCGAVAIAREGAEGE